jgi:DNA-binding beta-propeller fold protein YncE
MKHGFLAIFGCVLSGCSSSGVAPATVPAPTMTQPLSRLAASWMARDANPAHPWMYVTSGRDGNAIAIFDLAKLGTPQIGQIKQGLNPNGMALDASGTLYVADNDDYKGGGSVTIFPPGATTPSLTLTQGVAFANFVAVNASGDVYVVNFANPASIAVFPPGQTTPSQVISGGLIQRPASLWFDTAQNLYIADNTSGVLEVPAGTYQPRSLGLQGLSSPSGIVVDPVTGDLFVSSTRPATVQVYKPGLVAPIRKLRTSVPACVLGEGVMRGTHYVFVPDCNGSDVTVFKHEAKNATGVLSLPAPGNPPGASGIVFKPAGVP